MFYVYVLHSEKDGKLYTGFSNDLNGLDRGLRILMNKNFFP